MSVNSGDESSATKMKQPKFVLVRLTLLMVVIYIIGAIISAIITFEHVSGAAKEQYSHKLDAVASSRKFAVERYFSNVQTHAEYLAGSGVLTDAIQKLTNGFNQLEQDIPHHFQDGSPELEFLTQYYSEKIIPNLSSTNPDANNPVKESVLDYLPTSTNGRIAQWVYIAKNANPSGHKNEQYASKFDSHYETAHRGFHPQLDLFVKAFEFYDMFIFGTNGDLVYSTDKEIDFGTNFADDRYASTGLGKAYEQAAHTPQGLVITTDFSLYEPSEFKPAAFVAAPVFVEGKRIGVVAFQIDTKHMNSVVSNTQGMERSGEVYLVGKDLLMRSDSRFTETSTILTRSVNTTAAVKVSAGLSGTGIFPDYRDVEVMSVYRPLQINGLDWGIIAEVDLAEVLNPARTLASYIVGIFVIVLCVIGLAAFLTLRFCVARPLTQILTTVERFAKGDLNARVELEGKDEFCALASSHNRMADSIQGYVSKLEESLAEVKELRGMLPICCGCKSIRDDDGYFKTIESYLGRCSNLQFSHTLCNDCGPRMYPEVFDQK